MGTLAPCVDSSTRVITCDEVTLQTQVSEHHSSLKPIRGSEFHVQNVRRITSCPLSDSSSSELAVQSEEWYSYNALAGKLLRSQHEIYGNFFAVLLYAELLRNYVNWRGLEWRL